MPKTKAGSAIDDEMTVESELSFRQYGFIMSAWNRHIHRVRALEIVAATAEILIEGSQSDAEGREVIRRGDSLELAQALEALYKATP